MSSQDTVPKTFEQNTDRLKAVQERLRLPASTAETVSLIYQQAYNEDLYHGRSIDDILSSCLHLACKMERTPCNPTDIANEFNTTRQTILKTSRHFASKLGLKAAPVNPAGYIDQFSNTLSLSDSTRSLAHDIFSTYMDSGMDSGKSPTGLAAGAIYAATQETNERITQSALKEVADVSEVTIRNIYKKQLETYNNANSHADHSSPVSVEVTPPEPSD